MNRIQKIFDWINANWVSLALCFSVIGIVVGYFAYNLSIFQPIKEIAVKQEEYQRKGRQIEFQKRMVQRHLKLGNSFLNDSRYMAAKQEFKSALKLDQINPEAQMGLFKVSVYEDIQKKDFNPEVVERRISMILEENKHDPHAHVFLGDLYLQLDDKQKALAHYDRAINSDDKVASAFFGKGCVFHFYNKPDQALDMYKKAIELSKFNDRYLGNLGSIYLEKGDCKNAIETYKQVLKINPDFLMANSEIAIAHRLDKNFQQACIHQEIVVSGLSDKTFAQIDKNKDYWGFKCGKKTVFLSSIEEKRYYALYSFCASLFLYNKEQLAYDYARQAKEQAKLIQTFTRKMIENIVFWELQVFANKYPQYKQLINDFKKTISEP